MGACIKINAAKCSITAARFARHSTARFRHALFLTHDSASSLKELKSSSGLRPKGADAFILDRRFLTSTERRIGNGYSSLLTNSSRDLTSTPLERLKHPARGGRDLAGRYVRLERALRGKEDYEREIKGYRDAREEVHEDVPGGGGIVEVANARTSTSTSDGNQEERVKDSGIGISIPSHRIPLVFAGFAIPEEPIPPGPDECCMSGCAVCVHDLYAEAIEAHDRTLDALRDALRAKGIEEDSWPVEIRSSATSSDAGRLGPGSSTGEGRARRASLSAFEQMELQIAARSSQAQTPKSLLQTHPQTQIQTWNSPSSENTGDDPRPAPANVQSSPAAQSASLGVATKSRKMARGVSRGMKIDAKGILEALSWLVFSRR